MHTLTHSSHKKRNIYSQTFPQKLTQIHSSATQSSTGKKLGLKKETTQMLCTGAVHTRYTMHKITMTHIRPQYWPGPFPVPSFSFFLELCFYFAVKGPVSGSSYTSALPGTLQIVFFCTTRISWKAIKKKWRGIRDSEGQSRARNISTAILEKQKGKHATCELVERKEKKKRNPVRENTYWRFILMAVEKQLK